LGAVVPSFFLASDHELRRQLLFSIELMCDDCIDGIERLPYSDLARSGDPDAEFVTVTTEAGPVPSASSVTKWQGTSQ
jgi:hypothetical protein